MVLTSPALFMPVALDRRAVKTAPVFGAPDQIKQEKPPARGTARRRDTAPVVPLAARLKDLYNFAIKSPLSVRHFSILWHYGATQG